MAFYNKFWKIILDYSSWNGPKVHLNDPLGQKSNQTNNVSFLENKISKKSV